jgi:hypothetical protein
MQDKITPFGCATKVLRLQVLVLALGETSAPAWWRTEYLSGAGLRILERIYSRTAFAAAIHASGAAARTIHDASTGHGRIYHLFRLPIPWEREFVFFSWQHMAHDSLKSSGLPLGIKTH